jgi:hypothetical protein
MSWENTDVSVSGVSCSVSSTRSSVSLISTGLRGSLMRDGHSDDDAA